MPSPDYILTVVFGPDSAHGSPYLDLGAIKPYVKPTVKKKKKNLGVVMDSDFKLDKQINSVIKCSFISFKLNRTCLTRTNLIGSC